MRPGGSDMASGGGVTEIIYCNEESHLTLAGVVLQCDTSARNLILSVASCFSTHTHARTHTRTHARTHAHVILHVVLRYTSAWSHALASVSICFHSVR